MEDEKEGDTDKPFMRCNRGRPNAGKSIVHKQNSACGAVLVSDVPGTTRDSIDVPFSIDGRKYVLIDTAGTRREARVDTAVERYSRFRMQESIDRADIVVLMIDATRGVGLLDKQLASEITEKGKGCVIVVNKWDLITDVKEREYGEQLQYDIAFMSYCPVVYTSAETGHRLNQVLRTIEHVQPNKCGAAYRSAQQSVIESYTQSISQKAASHEDILCVR